MNPHEMQPETIIGHFVFYNMATTKYFMETDLTMTEYSLLVSSPILEYIGFFKSYLQASKTIEACIELGEAEKLLEEEDVELEVANKTPKKKKSISQPLKTMSQARPPSSNDIVTDIDFDDPNITEIYVDNINDLPDILNNILKDIGKKEFKIPKKRNKKKDKDNDNDI